MLCHLLVGGKKEREKKKRKKNKKKMGDTFLFPGLDMLCWL
jgi:hypothetical protein